MSEPGTPTRVPAPRTDRPFEDEPGFPATAGGRPIVVLVDAAGRLEERLIRAWAQRHRPAGSTLEFVGLKPSRRGRRTGTTDPRLAARLVAGDDPWVVPARVVWLPREHRGRRVARWSDALKLGDPRDPDPVRRRVILALHHDRVRLVVGEGASAEELLAAHRASVEVIDLMDFITRRAHLALERAERLVRGNRYKVPKFLHEEILGRPGFRMGVEDVAGDTGRSADAAFRRARRYLREIAASHSPFLIDLIANAIHAIYRQGYGSIVYEPVRVKEIAALSQKHSIAFLPSHRSNLDRLALQYLLWENDLPPNHTAAGINMNFFPVGPLIRRTGAFFIRRSFKDNPLYKYVLRSYLDFLVEKRFPLEWYLEGGRSRSGKLMAPRYGLLGWVVDAVRRGHADDVYLVPTSIAYDQIQDVGDFASEAQGGAKPKESFGWALSAIRSLRRRYGNIHVRFAEPISVTKETAALAGDPDAPRVDVDLQKLAFEVMYRIGQVTPVTPTAVVSIALLSAAGRGLTLTEIVRRVSEVESYVAARGLPTTEPRPPARPDEVGRLLAQLADHGSLSRFEGGGAVLFYLNPNQALQAAYYRNTIVHFFVPAAIAELALLAAPPVDPVAGFWDEVMATRDLLKFEFFFPDKEQFRRLVTAELHAIDPLWEDALGDPAARGSILDRSVPLKAHWALLPFLEAYRIVADQLVESPAVIEERPFLSGCLERGRRYRLQGLVGTDESVSSVLFASVLALARNRGLDTDRPGLAEARPRFATEVTELRDRAALIGEMAETRTGTALVD